MGRRYLPLTSISFKHGYYQSDPNLACGDILLSPTEDTASFLRRNRLLYGYRNPGHPHRFEVLRPYVEDGSTNPPPLTPLPDDFVLRFVATLRHPHFRNFTNLTGVGKDKLIVFSNQGTTSGELVSSTYRSMRLFSKTLSIHEIGGVKQVTATHEDSGISVSTESFAEGSDFMARIDLSNKPFGIYAITWAGGGTEVYYDPTLMGQDCFGIVHLKQASGGPQVNGDWQHTFMAQAIKWRYCILPIGGIVSPSFSISTSHFSFSPTDGNLYESPTVAPDDIAMAMQAGGFTKAIEFASVNEIPFQDIARSFISLSRDSGSNPLVTHLPNPSIANGSGLVLVTVEPPSGL